MALIAVFKNRIPNSNFVTAKGKQINFVGGRYETGIPDEVKELEAEVMSGNPHIYIDENDQVVDTEAPTPLQLLEKKIREQVLADIAAETAAATDKSNDRGETKFTGKLEGIANSSTVAEGAAGSDSNTADAAAAEATAVMVPMGAADIGAKLAALKTK